MSSSPLTYLVTGAGRGIGRGLSCLLLERGHRVFLLDSNASELSHAVKAFASYSAAGHAVADISDPDAVKRALAQVREWCGGRLDVLVNNAGVAWPYWSEGHSMETVDVAEWKKFIDTNLTGTFLVSQAAIPLLKRTQARKDGGAIVHISSTRAHMSEPNSEGYAATKAGILGLTHAMAASLGNTHGIRVNAIVPGWIVVDSENAEGDKAGKAWDEGLSEADHAQHFVGRAGKVEDVLGAVEYLSTAGFVTGQEIVLDGGMTKKMEYVE